jgi:hypothetical protein
MAALIQRRSRRCPVDEVISAATLNGMSPAFKSPADWFLQFAANWTHRGAPARPYA